MIAYNNNWLRNLRAREAATEAYENECISQDEYNNIKEALTVGFYTPDLFARIGIFILTVICVSCLLGLLMLMTSGDGYEMMTTFAGIISYAALELFTTEKKHYRSGVDDALVLMSALLVSLGIGLAAGANETGMSFIVLLVSTYLVLRFGNRLMAAASFASLISLLFFTFSSMGPFIRSILPFAVMSVSALIYFISRKAALKESLSLYSNCITTFEVLSLIGFYAAGNYFVARELSNSMFHWQLQDGEPIPYGFLFKIFTAIIPASYILSGIKKRDIVMLRVGALSLAASVLTFRYYHYLLGTGAALTLAGIILIAAAWLLIRYLKTPRHGFNYIQRTSSITPLMPQVESLVLAETLPGSAQQASDGTAFGGGSFGGAGAGDSY